VRHVIERYIGHYTWSARTRVWTIAGRRSRRSLLLGTARSGAANA
jgi:hypothetical protein